MDRQFIHNLKKSDTRYIEELRIFHQQDFAERMEEIDLRNRNTDLSILTLSTELSKGEEDIRFEKFLRDIIDSDDKFRDLLEIKLNCIYNPTCEAVRDLMVMDRRYSRQLMVDKYFS